MVLSPTEKILIGGLAAAGVGALIFFTTRRAAGAPPPPGVPPPSGVPLPPAAQGQTFIDLTLFDQATGEPLPNITVKVFTTEDGFNVQLRTQQTDITGFTRFLLGLRSGTFRILVRDPPWSLDHSLTIPTPGTGVTRRLAPQAILSRVLGR